MSVEEKENVITDISNLLEQIDKLNDMVDFHKNKSEDMSMMQQYESMRNDFINQLEQLLSTFKLDAKIKNEIDFIEN